jgi:glycosyltransferase involved in cell wall biosynthesis
MVLYWNAAVIIEDSARRESMPKVSVIMSVYNTLGEFLSESVESILNQTFRDFEFIIIDDCSTNNNIVFLLRNYAKQDTRIILHKNKGNLGLTRSLNIGIGLSQGEYIARQDSDDISYPQRIEKQVEFYNANSAYGLLGTWGNIIDDKTDILGVYRPLTDASRIKKDVLISNHFLHTSVMFPRRIINTVGTYDESIMYAQDYDYWIRISACHLVANIPEILVAKRVTSEAISTQRERLQEMYSIRMRLHYLMNGMFSSKAVMYLLFSIFRYLIPMNIRDFVRRNFLRSRSFRALLLEQGKTKNK